MQITKLGRYLFNTDTSTELKDKDTILLKGEIALESDTQLMKIGDGVNSYKNLPYANVGPKGDRGEKGLRGDVGPRGPKGEKGDTGNTGPRGLKGDRGEAGTSINILGVKNSVSDLPAKSNQGDCWLVGQNLYIFVDGSFKDVGSVKGPKGDIGPVGPQGKTGPQGPQGIAGPIGPKGPQGDVGPRGPQGATGEKGPIGPQGYKGERGPIGPKGDQGSPGVVEAATSSRVGSVKVEGTTSEAPPYTVLSKGNINDTVKALNENIDKKADKNHTHSIHQVDHLEDALSMKADVSHYHSCRDIESPMGDEDLDKYLINLQSTLTGKAEKEHNHAEIGCLINDEEYKYINFHVCNQATYENKKGSNLYDTGIFFIEEEQ